MKTILVVDDDFMYLKLAQTVLGSEYEVIAVKGGPDAVEWLKANTCDMILLDINMPGMSGFEVKQEISKMEQHQKTPVIFLTADNDAQTEIRCFKEGAVDFISKPFVADVMRSRIGRALELEELRSNLESSLEKKTLEVAEMQTKSAKDALTGLWNRGYTQKLVENMIQEGAKGALLMMDMDNFKVINDNYGHIAGDTVLNEFAECLRKNTGEGDVLCRIGGDEFVAFINGVTDVESLGKIAASIISDMAEKLRPERFDTNSSVSVGIAQCPEDGTEFEQLYDAADKALYYVKQNGKNAYHFYGDKRAKESGRAAKKVDLMYLQELMKRSDGEKGVYSLDFESFHHVYHFIHRFLERSNQEVQILLFTVVSDTGEDPEVPLMEEALDALEAVVTSSLRRADVATRYSSKQLIVILMNAQSSSVDSLAQRILNGFEERLPNKNLHVEYGIAKME